MSYSYLVVSVEYETIDISTTRHESILFISDRLKWAKRYINGLIYENELPGEVELHRYNLYEPNPKPFVYDPWWE